MAPTLPCCLPSKLSPQFATVWIFATNGFKTAANQRHARNATENLDIILLCDQVHSTLSGRNIPLRVLATILLGLLRALEKKINSCESAVMYTATKLSIHSRQSRIYGILSAPLTSNASRNAFECKSAQQLTLPKSCVPATFSNTIPENSDFCNLPPFRFSFTPGAFETSIENNNDKRTRGNATCLIETARNDKARKHINGQDFPSTTKRPFEDNCDHIDLNLNLNSNICDNDFEFDALAQEHFYNHSPMPSQPLGDRETNSRIFGISGDDGLLFNVLDDNDIVLSTLVTELDDNVSAVVKRKRMCLALDSETTIRMPVNCHENVDIQLPHKNFAKVFPPSTRHTEFSNTLLQDLDPSVAEFCVRKCNDLAGFEVEDIEIARHADNFSVDDHVYDNFANQDLVYSNLDYDLPEDSCLPWASRKGNENESRFGTPNSNRRRSLSRSNSLQGDERPQSLSLLSLTPLSALGDKNTRSQSYTSPLKGNSINHDEHLMFDLSQEIPVADAQTSIATTADESALGINWKKQGAAETTGDIENKETRQFFSYFNELIILSGATTIALRDIACSAGEHRRRAAARGLFHVLVLVGQRQLEVEQERPYAEILLAPVSTALQ